MKKLLEAEVENKRVFVRVDFNVPIKDGKITDDNRIIQALPTIKYLLENNAKIILGTHLGKPKGEKSAETSTWPCADRLSQLLGQEIKYVDAIVSDEVKEVSYNLQPREILMIGNLRWDPREEADDEGFGQELASLAEVYVNDAFAVSHRANASVSSITKFLPGYGGFLIEKEIENLSQLLENPPYPFVLVIGGVKIADKAGMIDKLAPIADKVIVGGGVANTFWKAIGKDIGQSVYDEEMVDACSQMLDKYQGKIVLPSDAENEWSEQGFAIKDLGPNTRHDYYEIVKNAAIVLWNGNMGYTEDEKFQQGSMTVAYAMRDGSAHSFLAGGDTAGFVINAGLGDAMTFISTGGGAALEFLAGLELPGIKAIS